MLYSLETLMPKETANFLTTRQLARLWHVSEATIKRWADAGHLSSTKTVGGHRRFVLDEVARFQNERDLGGALAAHPARRAATTATTTARSSRRKLREADVAGFFDAVAGGQDETATSRLLELYLSGVPLAQIFDRVVGGSLRRVGEYWHGGRMSVADEHLATRTALAALAALHRSAAPHRRGINRLTAICCAPEAELHEVPLACVQILLAHAGWRVVNLGANTPFYALADAVEKFRPRLVCVSSTANLALDRNAREYEQFRHVALASGSRIVLGGEGFNDPALRHRFPADLHADNFGQLAELIEAMTGE